MIGHYKHIILSRVHGFDALVWQEKHFFPASSLESRFDSNKGQAWILIIISIPFMIWHHKHILLIRVHDINTWFGKKSFFSTIFLIINVHPWNEKNLDTCNNLHYFVIGHAMTFSTFGYMILMLWICMKSFSFNLFPYNQSLSEKWDKLGYP